MLQSTRFSGSGVAMPPLIESLAHRILLSVEPTSGVELSGAFSGPGGQFFQPAHPGRYRMAVLESGRIVASDGNSWLAELLPDGSNSLRFGNGGGLATPFTISGGLAADGRKILVAGKRNGNWAIARYDGLGRLDASFGHRGISQLNLATKADSILDLAVQSNGKIVAVGSGPEHTLLVARFTPQGKLDRRFADHGIFKTQLDDSDAGLKVTADDRILVITRHQVLFLTRNGSIAPGFQQVFNSTLRIDAAAVGTDGSLLLASGIRAASEPSGIILTRITRDGSRDTSFGNAGQVQDNVPMTIAGMAIGADGTIYIAGDFVPDVAARPNPDEMGLAQYDEDGREVGLGFVHGARLADAIALRFDGQIIVAGHAVASSSDEYGQIGFSAAGFAPSLPQHSFLGERPDAGHIIEAENFDFGAQGVSYHDTTLQDLGGAYRSTAVDIEPHANGFHVSSTRAGEWLAYTVHASIAASQLTLRVASAGPGGTFHLESDGVDVSGPLQVPDTGGWDQWELISKDGVDLPAGDHILNLVMDSDGRSGAVGNFDWFAFSNGLDLSFGTPGVWGLGGPAAADPNGTIVVGGSRLSASGDILTTAQNNLASLSAMAVQPDEKTLLAGTADSKAVLIRLDASGQLDSSFGQGGIVTLPEPSDRLAVASDGAIYVGPSRWTYDEEVTPGDVLLGVQKFFPDGSSDPSFTPAVNAGLIGLTPDGKLLVWSYQGVSDCTGDGFYGCTRHFSVSRLLPDGTLDATYGQNGTWTQTAREEDGDIPEFNGMFVAPDGSAIIRIIRDNADAFVGAYQTRIEAIDPTGMQSRILADQDHAPYFHGNVAALSPDGAMLAVAGDSQLWNDQDIIPRIFVYVQGIRTELLQPFTSEPVRGLAFTPDGGLVVSYDTLIMKFANVAAPAA